MDLLTHVFRAVFPDVIASDDEIVDMLENLVEEGLLVHSTTPGDNPDLDGNPSSALTASSDETVATHPLRVLVAFILTHTRIPYLLVG